MFGFGGAKKRAEQCAREASVLVTFRKYQDSKQFFEKTKLRSSEALQKFDLLINAVFMFYLYAFLTAHPDQKFVTNFFSALMLDTDQQVLRSATDLMQYNRSQSSLHESGAITTRWLTENMGLKNPSDACAQFLVDEINATSNQAYGFILNSMPEMAKIAGSHALNANKLPRPNPTIHAVQADTAPPVLKKKTTPANPVKIASPPPLLPTFSCSTVTDLHAIATAGDSDAQYKLGVKYENGDGVEDNCMAAARWYKLSAEQGHAKAQFNLALLYKSGLGVTQNLQTAKHWMGQAANAKMSEAVAALDTINSLIAKAEADRIAKAASGAESKLVVVNYPPQCITPYMNGDI